MAGIDKCYKEKAGCEDVMGGLDKYGIILDKEIDQESSL